VNVESDIKAAAGRRAQAIKGGIEKRLPRKGETPWATGAERDHVIVVERPDLKEYQVQIADIPGRDPLVVLFHELGTITTKAYPAFRPATDENREGYIRDAEASVEKRMGEAG